MYVMCARMNLYVVNPSRSKEACYLLIPNESGSKARLSQDFLMLPRAVRYFPS